MGLILPKRVYRHAPCLLASETERVSMYKSLEGCLMPLADAFWSFWGVACRVLAG